MSKPSPLADWLQFLFIAFCITVPIAIAINGFVIWLVIKLMGV